MYLADQAVKSVAILMHIREATRQCIYFNYHQWEPYISGSSSDRLTASYALTLFTVLE